MENLAVQKKEKVKKVSHRDLKFFVALQTYEPPQEYIRIGKMAEKLGFDRIYVYDDLMYRPSWPIVNLVATYTKRIQLGPCVVNGRYMHPALIAQNIAFLDDYSQKRAILGLGRGAFYDFLNMDGSEYTTRKVCEETIQLVKKFLKKDPTPYKGEFFEANEKAVLRFDPPRPDIPLIMATWNEKMAYMAGQYGMELQIAEVWNPDHLKQIYDTYHEGALSTAAFYDKELIFNIGGMSCVSYDENLAYKNAKLVMSVYFPYLRTIMQRININPESEYIRQMTHYSKLGNYVKASSYITDDLVEKFSMTGHPDRIVEKLGKILEIIPVNAILFSPPYGPTGSNEENLQFIAENVIKKLHPSFGTEKKETTSKITIVE